MPCRLDEEDLEDNNISLDDFFKNDTDKIHSLLEVIMVYYYYILLLILSTIFVIIRFLLTKGKKRLSARQENCHIRVQQNVLR